MSGFVWGIVGALMVMSAFGIARWASRRRHQRKIDRLIALMYELDDPYSYMKNPSPPPPSA